MGAAGRGNVTQNNWPANDLFSISNTVLHNAEVRF